MSASRYGRILRLAAIRRRFSSVLRTWPNLGAGRVVAWGSPAAIGRGVKHPQIDGRGLAGPRLLQHGDRG